MNSLILLTGITILMSNPTISSNIPTIEYTSDSAVSKGIALEPYKNELDETVYKIVIDLPAGYEIYDDPDTSYIDGLKINNRWLEAYDNVYFREGEDSLTVKVVYTEDVTGKLAQINDGTFNWWSLLETPIGIIASLFSGTSLASMVGLAVNIYRSKKLKVKDSNEISKEVKTTVQEESKKQAEESKELLKTFTEEIVTPILTEFRNEVKDILKAIAISNSKQKDAPLAILDLLEKDTSDEKVKAVIAEAREKFKESLDKEEKVKKAVSKKLAELNNKITTVSEDIKKETTDSAEGRY